MGMQEYLVTCKHHTPQEFFDIFNEEASISIATPKEDIEGKVDDEPFRIPRHTDLIVIYGDRHDIRDMLYEKFSEEEFWGSEYVNKAVFGTWEASWEQVDKFFHHRGILEPAPKKWLLKIGYSWGEEEPDQVFLSKEDAWEKARQMALEEAETASWEHDCEVGLAFDKEAYAITLHYTYDSEYCRYSVIEE